MKRPAAIVLGTTLLAAGCGPGEDDTRILASGYVEATEVQVSTKVGGILEELHVDEGSIVEKGQEMARIDTVDTRLALDSARAELARAQAELRLRLAGPRAEDIDEARAQLARTEADLAGAVRDLERMEGLLAAGSGTTKARDDARTRHDVAAAAVEAARQRLRRLEAGFRSEEKDAARARVKAAEARIAQLEQQLEDASIRSPVGGIVTRKLADEGELMAPGSGIIIVTDLANAWLNAYIPEPALGRIRLGQEAEVVTDDGQSRTGRVSFVASEAEFTPKNVQTRDERVKLVFRIKVALDNEDGLFKPGMPATAFLDPAGGER
jgi:HlyD family secretion protein